MGVSGEKHMRRRRFLACGLGMAAAVAGCGTERAGGAVPVAGFTLKPDGRRWERVGQAFAGAAQAVGYQPGGGFDLALSGLPAAAAAELNNSQSILETATPLARLSGEALVVVVPDGSPLKDFGDFGARMLADPGRTRLAGGSPGEPDHLLFGLIARALGADTRQVDYTGYPSGGEVMAALLSGRAVAAAGPLSTWRAGIERRRIRPLAVSSATRLPELDAPTLLECGVRVDFSDWVGAFGPEGMAEEGREAAVHMCDEVLGSSAWEAACRAAGWLPIPLAGDDFARWLHTELARTRAVLRDLGMVDTTKATTCWGSCGNGH
ncbi:tripartite tricarboxylate transporter substrate-binding protein [Nonomuraea sp. N2-4H]|jgi:putative tricarboxylic transport membrane protein|uniref:tripartite tricarboxylate transporter substrate-binding protein n=1 Tax=unclassified Nonomuraea TaxID=2593643 RepID=UPI00324C3209